MAQSTGSSYDAGQPTSPAVNIGKRQRRRDGCLTCRKRRVGCDRQKPECQRCEKLALSCSWPPEGGLPRKRRQRNEDATTDTQPPPSPRAVSPESGAFEDLFGNSQASDFSHLLGNPHATLPVPTFGGGLTTAVDQTDAAVANDPRNTSPFDFSSFGFHTDILDSSLNFELFASLTQESSSLAPMDMTLQESVPRGCFPGLVYTSIRKPVTPQARDQPIIAHFLESVSQAATVRSRRTPNHYISLHAVSLFYAPLYAGVLAWSAWHMATTLMNLPEDRRKELLDYGAQQHAVCGFTVFQGLDEVNLDDIHESDAIKNTDLISDVEAVFCALMVYCQYEIITSSPPSHLRKHMEQIDRRFGKLVILVKAVRTPLLDRMATILAAFDVRSAMFAFRVPRYALRLGTAFFEVVGGGDLDQSTALSGNTASLHIHYLEAKCVEIEVRLRNARKERDTPALRNTLRDGDQLYDRISDLKETFDPSGLDPLSRNNDLAEFEQGRYRALPLDADVTCDIFLACWYNTLVIYVSRILNYPAPQRSVDRIIGASQTLLRYSPAPSHVVLAKPLFFAGLEATDEKQIEWIHEILETPGSRGWGPAQKTSELLREMRAVGNSKEIGQVIDQPRFNFIV